jgi:acetyl esterase/lipase
MTDPSIFDHEVAQAWRRFPPPEIRGTHLELARSAYGEYFRAVTARPEAPPRTGVAIEDAAAPSRVDDHSVPLRIYRPEAVIEGRCLVYIHGGAFVMGDLEFEDERCFLIARDAGCVIVSVDYRLAPEHPFPLPLEDCYSALRWVADEAEALGVEARRIGVGGCSAGGALAASTAILSRERSGPQLALQMLLCPVLDASLSRASVRALLSEEDLRDCQLMWDRYLGRPRAEAPELASPSSYQDLAGLPPAYIQLAELDYLRDEGLAYAQRLVDAGVTVEAHLWPRVPHAFELFAPDARVSRESVREQAAALARFLR